MRTSKSVGWFWVLFVGMFAGLGWMAWEYGDGALWRIISVLFYFLAFWCFVLVVSLVFGGRSDKEQHKHLRRREKQYWEAAPERYPFIVDNDAGIVTVKYSDVEYKTMPESKAKGIPTHPAATEEDYVGRPYRSLKP